MSAPPPLPARAEPSQEPATANVPEDATTLLLSRQIELYSQPSMSESSDVFALRSLNDETARKLVDSVVETDAPADDAERFWSQFVLFSESEIAKNVTDGTVPKNLVSGVPNKYRGFVYLRATNAGYQLSKERYKNLLNKAVKENNSKIDELAVSPETKNALKVFSYYVHQVLPQKSDDHHESGKAFEFVLETSKILNELPHITEEQVLYLLLKFNKLISNLNTDEWTYKVGRAIEDLVPDAYSHFSKQGIDLNLYLKTQLYTIFQQTIGNPDFLTRLFDFILFEGFDYLARVFVYLFQTKSDEISGAFGAELSDLLNSAKFFDSLDNTTFKELESIEPKYISYENEYQLLNVNSLSNNNNELLNSQEINEDLQRQIEDLNSQLENLRTTHTEILSQSKDYELQVEEALKLKATLTEEYDKIKSEHDTLSMKSNLDNTIKANQEFSEGNRELEAQIAAVKKSVEEKAAKVAKYSTA